MQITQVAKFRLRTRWIREDPSEIAGLFAMLDILPLKINHWLYIGEVEYVAVSENFRPVETGLGWFFDLLSSPVTEGIPEVDIEVTRDKSRKIISARVVYIGEGK